MLKQRVGITGQHGFIGQALFNTLGLFPNEFVRIPFKRDFFENQTKLIKFVSECDVIIHLAALNRHTDAMVIYETNLTLVHSLINALEKSKSKAHIIFASSTQEERDNLYGRSKKEGRNLLANWASKSGGKFTGLIIPNVFGQFCNPYYNSFIATFSYQLIHGEKPKIDIDLEVKLIYINELVNIFIQEIRNNTEKFLVEVLNTSKYKVSKILELLQSYEFQYFKNGSIPELNSSFEVNLFNTFRSYIDYKNHFPVKYVKNIDPRGIFIEIIRLNIGGQVSLSVTVPGEVRGNHYHTNKIERFSVIRGKALIQLRQIGTIDIISFFLDGDEPSYVDIPIWYTHNIKNVGEEDLYTSFWINKFYDPNDSDTYFENV